MPTLEIIDPDTKKKLAQLYPDYQARMIRTYNDFYNLHNKRLRMTEGYRSPETQAHDYAQGRTAPGHIITHALPLQSFHQFACAADSCFNCGDPYLEDLQKRDSKSAQFYWNEFGRFAKANGLEWGGDWAGSKNDRPHTQIRYGLTLAQIQELYHHGGIQSVFAKFDQIRGVEIGEGWKNNLQTK